MSHVRVLRFITRMNIGGPARQALLLTRELSGEWPTTLVAGSLDRGEGELSDTAVPVRRIPLVRPVRPHHDARAVLAARSLIRQLGPQIVHTHMAKAGLVGRLAATSLHRCPATVHTFHGHVLEGYFSSPMQRMILGIERGLATQTDVIVAISPQVRDSLLDLEVGTEDQYRLIPLGFDLDQHLAVSEPSGKLRRHIGVAADVPLVGVVGRLVPIKDLDTLLEAIASLPDVHLAILGDGESRASLRRLADVLAIGHRTHFVGWWTDIPAAMSDLDVVALSSLNEGTPVSLIEALACARPVVATDVGGVPFVVEHARTGLLCPPRDPTALAESVERLLGDRELANAFARAGRDDVSQRFRKERLVSDIAALYRFLV